MVVTVHTGADAHWRKYETFLAQVSTPEWVFRGHSDRAWKLRPKVGREDVLAIVWDEAAERGLFAEFKRRARQFESGVEFSDWDWLALAQHYGLPTRLLDWTQNPLVATYFAVASQPSETTAEVVAVRVRERDYLDLEGDAEWGVPPEPFGRETWPPWMDDESRVGFVRPLIRAPRMISQRGVFSVHLSPAEEWRGFRRRRPKQRSSRLVGPSRFEIPVEFRDHFQQRLAGLGVDASSILADLGGICDALTWRYTHPYL